jgi:hypothetical protein
LLIIGMLKPKPHFRFRILIIGLEKNLLRNEEPPSPSAIRFNGKGPKGIKGGGPFDITLV